MGSEGKEPTPVGSTQLWLLGTRPHKLAGLTTKPFSLESEVGKAAKAVRERVKGQGWRLPPTSQLGMEGVERQWEGRCLRGLWLADTEALGGPHGPLQAVPCGVGSWSAQPTWDPQAPESQSGFAPC